METKMSVDSATSPRATDYREAFAAWLALLDHVDLGKIRSEKHYRDLVALADKLSDEISDNQRHPLMKLFEVIALILEQHEKETVCIEGTPRAALAYLMEQHHLTQSDLRSEVGSQGVVSEVLRGKRAINARQAKALGNRFGVPATVFL
jgi:HTH-type transcriptional regulator/antitoxin HigA